MKRFLLVSFTALFFVLANAQDSIPGYNYLFKKENYYKNAWKCYSTLTFQHLCVKTNTMPGLEVGLAMNNNLMLGIYGQGTVGNFYNESYAGNFNVVFGEAGIMAGYLSEPNKTLHFGGLLKLGHVSMFADDEEIKIFKGFEPVAKDKGIVYHPEVFSELNVSRYMKIRLGAGYSFYLLDRENIMCNKTLDSWTLNMGIVFSNFPR
jgi:hypothetical protein